MKYWHFPPTTPHVRPNVTLQMKNCIGPEWDLNPRPAVYMTAALTNWATRPLTPEKPVSWCQSERAVACGVLLPLMFSCTTQLTLQELRITSKLPWQIYFRLATGDINIFEEPSVKYQWGPLLSPGGDRSQLMIFEAANWMKYWHFPPTTPMWDPMQLFRWKIALGLSGIWTHDLLFTWQPL